MGYEDESDVGIDFYIIIVLAAILAILPFAIIISEILWYHGTRKESLPVLRINKYPKEARTVKIFLLSVQKTIPTSQARNDRRQILDPKFIKIKGKVAYFPEHVTLPEKTQNIR